MSGLNESIKLKESMSHARMDDEFEAAGKRIAELEQSEKDLIAAKERIKELEQEHDEFLVLADEFRKTGNRVINYGENANQWSHLTCHNDPSNLLTNRDLEQQAKGIEDARRYNVQQRRKLGSAWGAGHIVQDLQEREKQLRKQAEELE